MRDEKLITSAEFLEAMKTLQPYYDINALNRTLCNFNDFVLIDRAIDRFDICIAEGTCIPIQGNNCEQCIFKCAIICRGLTTFSNHSDNPEIYSKQYEQAHFLMDKLSIVLKFMILNKSSI